MYCNSIVWFDVAVNNIEIGLAHTDCMGHKLSVQQKFKQQSVVLTQTAARFLSPRLKGIHRIHGRTLPERSGVLSRTSG